VSKQREKTLFDMEVEEVIRKYLNRNNWKLSLAAKELGISIPTARKYAERGGFWPAAKQPA
jgi:transcriptional regulator of acetoin/glycerol metabolism